MKINSLDKQTHAYLIHIKGFKDINLNRALPSLHDDSLEFMQTVPLSKGSCISLLKYVVKLLKLYN